MIQWSEQLRLMKEQKGRGERPTPIYNELFFATVRDHFNTHADRLTGGSETHSMQREWNNETQCALRCATLACLADASSRRTMQELAVVTFSWHLALLRIISSPPSGGDRKSRLLAARLLTNLVTGNLTTASTVITSIPLSPSPEQISDSIRLACEYDEELTGSERSSIKSLNWVDEMLACSRSENRDALAAVVAAMHNCVAVVDDKITLSVATDPILISTTLRHILPSKAVVRDSKASAADEATEWISLFLEQLTGLGLLPTLYDAVGSSSIVTPEHLVLLQCISGRVDEWLESSNVTSSLHPLGNTDDRLIETHLFLARLASRMRKSTNDCTIPAKASSSTTAAVWIEPLDSDFSILTKSALIVVLEILATSLGSDSSCDVMALVRSKLGSETDIILEASLDLGVTVDALLLSSRGVKARELKLQDEDQRWITTLVRVLGNACFRCRPNQDALRHIRIPTMLIEDHPLHPQGQEEELHRTALHVLLSCTSLAYGCFTLREWSIVALRNALEGNLDSQTLVEKLEAQQPLQSPELEKMGIQVDLDRQGKVKVVPTAAAAASSLEPSNVDSHLVDS